MALWYFAHSHEHQAGGEKFMQYLRRTTQHTFLNPFDGQKEDPQEIVNGDLLKMADCHGLVAWFTMSRTQQIGTPMEVFYAARFLGKPVLIWCPPRLAVSPWLKVHGRVTMSILELVGWLREVPV